MFKSTLLLFDLSLKGPDITNENSPGDQQPGDPPGDGNGGDGDGKNEQDPWDGRVLGMAVLVASELVMFVFLSLVCLLARDMQDPWPPENQPQLPVFRTAISSIFLMVSGYYMFRAYTSSKDGFKATATRNLLYTALLGSCFVLGQSIEWVGLIQFGLTLHTSLYGAMFYLLVGTHVLHVTLALGGVFWVWRRTCRLPWELARNREILLCLIFWNFVVLIWPLLFTVVYLV